MNAAVLHAFDEPPHFEQFSEPIAEEDELIVHTVPPRSNPSTSKWPAARTMQRSANCPSCGALRIDTERVPLGEVENAWRREQEGWRAVMIP